MREASLSKRMAAYEWFGQSVLFYCSTSVRAWTLHRNIEEGERQLAGDNNEKYFSRHVEITSEASRQIHTN